MADVVNGCTIFTPGEAEETLMIDGTETGGAFAAIVGVVPPGAPGPPLHLHPNTDEAFYVAEGKATFKLGDQEIVAGPGSLIFVPKETVHTVWNDGPDPVRGLIFITPGDAEHEFVPVETD
jgi:quercetin dioxygenase-like cupin family protein